MSAVYVFSSIGRFQSFKDLRKYIDKSYTADGVGIPSDFIQEVGLSEYEPACIEAVVSETGIISLEELLADVSYADQWKINFPLGRKADAAICGTCGYLGRVPGPSILRSIAKLYS